jgi:hypothetical protein
VFFADKYIRITDNDTREEISKAIYRGRDRQDSNQPSDPGQESQNQTPGVSASVPAPAKDEPGPPKDLPVPAKELPGPAKDQSGLVKDLTAPVKPVPAKDTPVPAKNRPDADELANVLLTALATPKRFNLPFAR